MTTVSQLVDRISNRLHSYTGIIENVTYLTDAVDADDLVLPVANPQALTRGIVEIDDELLFINKPGATSVDVMPFGRGYQDSTAATHVMNAKVTNDPQLPRVRIFEDVKDTVRQITPNLYIIKTTTFLFSAAQAAYELPADVDRVLSVRYEDVGPSMAWLPIRRWDLDSRSELATARTLTLLDGTIIPGRTVQVVYAAPLPVPTAMSDDLETLGIPATMHDVLMFGACWRLTQFLEAERFRNRSVEQQARQGDIRVGDITRVSKEYERQFEIRREQERRRLQDLYPPTMNHRG